MARPPAAQTPSLLAIRSEREARIRAGTWSGGIAPHIDYQDKPVEWIIEKLGVREETIRWSVLPEYEGWAWDGTPDPLVVGLEAIARGESIAVSAGTNTSKSYVLGACLTLWFLAVYKDSIVLTIAPREKQLTKNLWKYIGILWPAFKEQFHSGELFTGVLRMYGDDPDKRETWTATALTAAVGADEEVAQNLAGFHAPEMLWILEETPGIEDPIIKTILNTATGRFNPICALGNRDHQHDALGQLARKDRFHDIRISCYDFPNIVTGRNIVDGAVTQQSIDDRLDDADGDESDPIYLSRVRGIAPAQSQRALIKYDWCEEAAKQWGNMDLRDGPAALGVDVADSPSGDASAISRWQGACCTEVETIRASDASEVGRMVFREANDSECPVDPRRIGIDSVGVGASAVNELKRLGMRVRTISGGKRAVPKMDVEDYWSATTVTEDGDLKPAGPKVTDVGEYANMRSQVYWRLREDLRLRRIALPRDKLLFEELTILEYDDAGGTKVTVMPKDKVKVRLGRSPDRADALAYGNWVRERTPQKRTLTPEELEESGMVMAGPNRSIGLERLVARVKKRRAAEDRRLARRLKGGP